MVVPGRFSDPAPRVLKVADDTLEFAPLKVKVATKLFAATLTTVFVPEGELSRLKTLNVKVGVALLLHKLDESVGVTISD